MCSGNAVRVAAKSQVARNRLPSELSTPLGLPERIRVHFIDVLLKMVVTSFKENTIGAFPSCVGRTFDLKAAYRHFGIDARSRDVLRIVMNNADTGTPTALGVNTLLFGAVGSVAGSVRISVALWFIGLAALRLCWTAFYDDFTALCRTELFKSTE